MRKVEQQIPATYVERMTALESAVATVGAARVGGDMVAYDWFNALDFAISAAWDNANDTAANGDIENTPEEIARIAYASICYTPSFEREEVRAFFKQNGYKW